MIDNDVFSPAAEPFQARAMSPKVYIRAEIAALPIPVSVVTSIYDVGVKRPFRLETDMDYGTPPKAKTAPKVVTREDIGSAAFADNVNFLCNTTIHWGKWCHFCETAAREFHYEKKQEACLFSPTRYELIVRGDNRGGVLQGFRNRQNATYSAMVGIDIDVNTLTIEQVRERFEEASIEAMLWSTASDQDGTRFRICVPLPTMMSASVHEDVVDAICEWIEPGFRPDEGKRSPAVLFYLPAQYKCSATNRFYRVQGNVYEPSEWIARAGTEEVKPNGKLNGAAHLNGASPHNNAADIETFGVETTWSDYADCPYVRLEWVQEYQALTQDSYNGLYSFICRVATGMIRRGLEPTREQLAHLAFGLESSTGRTHKKWDIRTRDLDAEASNAIAYSRQEVANTPNEEPPPIAAPRTKEEYLAWMYNEDGVRLTDRDVPEDQPEKPDPEEYTTPEPEPDQIGDQAKATTALTPLPIWNAGKDDEWIEPRPWLLGKAFCRGFVSSLFASGGSGKTSLRIAQAVGLASGKEITGEKIWRRCRVLLVSLEDDEDELRRRIRACCIHHKIDRRTELAGWLFCSNLSRGEKLALMNDKGKVVDGGLELKLAQTIKEKNIDLMILDPFKKTHGCPENDNTAMDVVTDLLTNMAMYLNVAVDVPHHVAKGVMEAGSADAGRGSSAFRDGLRLSYTLTRMTEASAEGCGISEHERWRYVQVVSSKVNITPNSTQGQWFKLVGVPLGNNNATYPDGDNVQTVETYQPTDIDDLRGNQDLLNHVLGEIASRQEHALFTKTGKKDGDYHICRAFQRHNKDITPTQATKITDYWIADQHVKEVLVKGENRHERRAIVLIDDHRFQDAAQQRKRTS